MMLDPLRQQVSSLHNQEGAVLWFTGMSGAGKTTLCRALAVELERRLLRVIVIDGDELRAGLCSDLGFTEEDRLENHRRIAHVVSLLSRSGTIVLVATMSPLNSIRRLTRGIIPHLLDVFVDAPLTTCEARDPKGLYRRARCGGISGLSGFDLPFEPPLCPWLTCKTAELTVSECVALLLNGLGLDAPVPRPAVYIDNMVL